VTSEINNASTLVGMKTLKRRMTRDDRRGAPTSRKDITPVHGAQFYAVWPQFVTKVMALSPAPVQSDD
jgi:hypothetical protein